MSTYTGTLTVEIKPAIGLSAATELDEAAIIAEVKRRINELSFASVGSAMVTLVATIEKDS